jgi:hypothetical protein
MAHGLAQRLKAFLDALPRAGSRGKAPADQRRRLATELLGTLSPQVLAATGHWRRMAPAATAARARRRASGRYTT